MVQKSEIHLPLKQKRHLIIYTKMLPAYIYKKE